MITLTIAGQDYTVAAGSLTMPRQGAWLGRFVANVDVIPRGSLTATLAGVDMPAWIQRAELVKGQLEMRVVGGFGGLAKTAKAKHYRNPTVRHVLSDLVTGAGENLSPTCTKDVLDLPLGYWTTLALPTGALLQALADVAGGGVLWRVLFDGSVWFGRETWPMCPAEVRIVDHDVANGSQVLGTDACGIWPGTTVGGRRVDLVVHEFGASPRSRVWWAEEHA